jgi:hypothetical protein
MSDDEVERSQAPAMRRPPRPPPRLPPPGSLPPGPRAPFVRPRQPIFPIRTTGKTGPDEPRGTIPPTFPIRTTGKTGPGEPRGTIPMIPRPVLETNVYEPPAIAYTPGELTDFVTRMYGTTPTRDDDATAT